MGGKNSTQTSQITIPPDVLARYNSVNNSAQQVAQTPFQTYGGQFVAPVNSTQQGGIDRTTAAANQAQQYYQNATGQLGAAQAAGSGVESGALGSIQDGLSAAQPFNSAAGNYYTGAYNNAQPYNANSGSLIGAGLGAATPLNQTAETGLSGALAGASPYNAGATGLALAGGQAVNPGQLNIGHYLSPYLSTVLGGTSALLNQNNQQAMSGQLGNTIRQGAFGGDRGGIAAANLSQQQNIANANIYSGILNEGYNNALGAAQQQQGVGLGAGQANRAALANASQQLAGIGNQVYTQGTGTAQAQAGQGQLEYQQALGAAQQEQLLGNQVFGQESTTGQNQQGLGQQVFGQGLAAGQARGQIGQNIYGMGANTSAATAALGAGAQAANLQGAQAQLAAGQVQQQTQQANDTAQYNQFLQQQSYPFQVQQFLANIAEGTGALSGSTTTTTAPQSIFSDKRLKTDIKEIGKTFDKQPIYSFRYKGDGTTHMGLMAQDVEEKHPDAVGLASGFKTVDYKKATEDAGERGKFASGGSPILPGLSGADMQSLLEARAAMYAPYGAGGIYGAQSGSSPRGGSSYVPQANLPVAHLATSGPAPAQRSVADSVKDAVDTASKIGNLATEGKKAYTWAQGLGSASNDNLGDLPLGDASSGGDYRRGGLIHARAKRYASGGLPYMDQVNGEALDIPNDQPNSKLQTPDAPKSSDGGGGLSDALAIAKMAAMVMGMRRGGRTGYDGGGGVDGDAADINTPSDGGGDQPWYLKPIPSPSDTGHAIMNAVRDAGGAYSKDQAERQANSSMFTAASMPPAKQAMDVAAPAPASAKVIPHPRRAQGLAAASTGIPIAASVPAAQNDSDLGELSLGSPTGPSNSDLGDLPLGGAVGSSDSGNDGTGELSLGNAAAVPQASTTSRAATIAHNIASSVGSNISDYASGLKHGDTQNWVPLLAAIAGAGSAPTVHPGVALAAGLGAGAQSYMNTKKSLADIAQTQAATGQIGATTAQTQAQTTQRNLAVSLDLKKRELLGLIKQDPGGPIVDPGTGLHYSPSATGPSQTSAGQFKYLGQAAQAALGNSANQFVRDSMPDMPGSNPGNIATSNKVIGDTYAAASDAKAVKTLLNEQAASLFASNRQGGPLQQGAMAPIYQPMVERWNSIVSDAGHGPDSGEDLTIHGLGDAQIAHKLQLGMATAQSTAAGQHAASALTDYVGANAGIGLDPKAAAVLAAQNAVQNTKMIDQQNALDEAKHFAPNGNYEAQDILTAFNHDNPPTVYNAMRDAVANIYQKPEYAQIHAALASPGSAKYQTVVNTLNAYGKLHGIPNFARVFTGD